MREEIKRVRKELIEIGKKLADKNFIVGPGGNHSIKLGSVVYMKASGIAPEEAKETDYVGVDINTEKVVDGKLKPTSEVKMHLECYRVRPEINAVLHSHPPLSLAYAMLGKSLKLYTPDLVAFVRTEIPVIKYVVPTGMELAIEVREKIKKHNGVFMCNHGILTVGINMKEAYYRTLLIESAVETIIAAKTLGKMKYLPKQQVSKIDGLASEEYRREKLKKS
jgi:L-fuculose-phosphate aldolase